jgi:hypothetical protein
MRNAIPVAAVVASLWCAPSFAQQGVEIGQLDCVVEGGTGFIIGSSKDVTCTFTPAGEQGAAETYFGSINKIGLDLGSTATTAIEWSVLAPSQDAYASGSLAGAYVGAAAEATAAADAGVTALVGGTGQSFTLQPVDVEAQTGANLALGVTEFQLRSTR